MSNNAGIIGLFVLAIAMVLMTLSVPAVLGWHGELVVWIEDTLPMYEPAADIIPAALIIGNTLAVIGLASPVAIRIGGR